MIAVVNGFNRPLNQIMVVVVGVGGGIAGIAQLHLQRCADAGISLQDGEKQGQCVRNE